MLIVNKYLFPTFTLHFVQWNKSSALDKNFNRSHVLNLQLWITISFMSQLTLNCLTSFNPSSLTLACFGLEPSIERNFFAILLYSLY